MPRAFSPTARRVAIALGLVLGIAANSPGQTTIYNSGGYEGYSANFLFPQDGFLNFTPTVTAGMIQTATVHGGTRAFTAIGSLMEPNAPLAGGNFWWHTENFDVTPTRYLQVSFAARLSTPTTFIEMPFGGVFLEGKNAVGGQQVVTPVMLNKDGGVTVGTTMALGEGTSMTVATADSLFAKGSWHDLFTEIDFQNQTFRVYKAGDPIPLQFQTGAGAWITDVPLRNFTGQPTTSIVELGMVAFMSDIGGGGQKPTNDLFIDDFSVTVSNTSLAPVPEPGLVLAIGAAGLAGWRVYRRRKTAIA